MNILPCSADQDDKRKRCKWLWNRVHNWVTDDSSAQLAHVSVRRVTKVAQHYNVTLFVVSSFHLSLICMFYGRFLNSYNGSTHILGNMKQTQSKGSRNNWKVCFIFTCVRTWTCTVYECSFSSLWTVHVGFNSSLHLVVYVKVCFN